MPPVKREAGHNSDHAKLKGAIDMYCAKWFKSLEDAKAFQKVRNGALYRNDPKSRTRRDHIVTAAMMGFDPEEFRYSVNWTMPKAKTEI